MKDFIHYLLAILISAILFSCTGNQSTEPNKEGGIIETSDSSDIQHKTSISASEDDDISSIKKRSKEILTLLKNEDYLGFAEYIHPGEGLRFSPYAFIDTINDVRLSKENFKEAIKTNKKFTWGYSDGSGDPIEMKIADYFQKFIYNADFLNSSKTAVNKIIGSGNSKNNMQEIYPDMPFFESYDPGKHEMAWSALRFVFKKEGGNFYLVAVIHNQWTI